MLILNSALVHATTVGAWTLSNPMAVGASILYDGSKGVVTSSVLITPNASQVAKVLRGGIAGYALSFAVEQLLGAVDWVLDPTNNRIVYKNEVSYDVICYGSPSSPQNCVANATISDIEKKYGCLLEHVSPESQYSGIYNGKKFTWIGSCVSGSLGQGIMVGEMPLPEEKTLPLETVAQKVIENAESDNIDAQFAVLAAANNILSEAENDDAKAIEDELENNAKCPSGIVRNGSCWICDKSQFMPITRATRDAKTATRGKSCKNVTDTAIKTANATLFRNLINARIQENSCWSPPDPNHTTALVDAQNALSLCEN